MLDNHSKPNQKVTLCITILKKKPLENLVEKREYAIGQSKILSYGKYLIKPFPNKPWFIRFCSTSLLKTLGKGEIAHNRQFLLFPQCLLPIFIRFKTGICKLFHFGRV